MKPNVINEGLKYGLICGLIAVVLAFGSWAAGDSIYANVQTYSSFVPYMFAIIIYAAFALRKQNGGFISFAEVLKFSFLAFTTSTVILAIGNYVLFNFVDTGLTARIAEIGLERVRKMMDSMGSSEEDIEKAVASARESMGDTGFKKTLLGAGISIVAGFVEALIISAFAKKEEKFSDQ